MNVTCLILPKNAAKPPLSTPCVLATGPFSVRSVNDLLFRWKAGIRSILEILDVLFQTCAVSSGKLSVTSRKQTIDILKRVIAYYSIVA